MTIDYSHKNIIVDDFIEGRRGQRMIAELRKAGTYSDYEALDVDLIRKSILKQLGNKKYDLMVFVESGGVYFLAVPEIIGHAKKSISLPISSHNPKFNWYRGLSSYFKPYSIRPTLDQYEELIKSSNSIAIVEGDIGNQGNSAKRLFAVKDCIQEINNGADVDVIVGIATGVYQYSKNFNIIGVVARDIQKLSDLARALAPREPGHLNAAEQKLVEYWERRKSFHPIMKGKK